MIENMYAVTLGVALLLLAGVRAQGECPGEYELYHGKCYRVSVDETCWDEARGRCESSGGILANPRNQDEVTDILTVASQYLDGQFVFWLGFSDVRNEGAFVDVNGGPMVFDTFPPGEPNDLGGEDCVELYHGGAMNDLSCETTRSFVCTADAPAVQELPCRCPASWAEYDGDCYRFFGLDRTFTDSEANCGSYVNPNGQLAHVTSITSDAENEFVTQLTERSWPGTLKRTWLGFTDRQEEGVFEWTDNVQGEYDNWNSNEPNDSGGNEDCAEINFNHRGGWNDTPCSMQRASVCKMPVYDPMEACHALAEQINQLAGQCNEVLARK